MISNPFYGRPSSLTSDLSFDKIYETIEDSKYKLTNDISIIQNKKYYIYNSNTKQYSKVNNPSGSNPKEQGWYEEMDDDEVFIGRLVLVKKDGDKSNQIYQKVDYGQYIQVGTLDMPLPVFSVDENSTLNLPSQPINGKISVIDIQQPPEEPIVIENKVDGEDNAKFKYNIPELGNAVIKINNIMYPKIIEDDEEKWDTTSTSPSGDTLLEVQNKFKNLTSQVEANGLVYYNKADGFDDTSDKIVLFSGGKLDYKNNKYVIDTSESRQYVIDNISFEDEYIFDGGDLSS